MATHQQIDWTKNKPTLIEQLTADVQLHTRSIELARSNRRYSIHRSDSDYQLSINLTCERLQLKLSLLEKELSRVGG